MRQAHSCAKERTRSWHEVAFVAQVVLRCYTSRHHGHELKNEILEGKDRNWFNYTLGVLKEGFDASVKLESVLSTGNFDIAASSSTFSFLRR